MPAAPFRLFYPILAGATLRDRVIASGGACLCLAGTGLICARSPFAPADLTVLAAPLGASAVLMFAVPASPLAQPWSIFGGNVVSAVIGVLVFQLLGNSALALGLAVGAAILGMSLLRCLHPPGGAVAMTAVVGGPAIWQAGYTFPFGVVAFDSLVLIVAGLLFHRISGHSYPHRPKAGRDSAQQTHHLHRSDVSRAIADAGETFDISPDDLEILLERAEHYASLRGQADAAAGSSRFGGGAR